jgi:very-short-patch-repair endonuclease
MGDAVRYDATIADLAREQHGLVTVGQLREAGGSRRDLERRVLGGQLERVNHHVYRMRSAPPTWESSVLAGVLAAGPLAAASHLTAAALWDLDGFARRGRPELSIQRGPKHRPSDVRCHQSTDLDRCSLVARDGIPTTDLSRTLLDLGRYFGVGRLSRIVESARRTHGLELIHTLLRHARQGRHGIRRLRAVIDILGDRSEVTDSEFEMLVLSLLAEHGLPKPVLHHRVQAGEVLVAELDLAWPERMVAVELHGQHHRESPVWEADQVKIVELNALGWTVLPFTWRVYVDQRAWMLGRISESVTR